MCCRLRFKILLELFGRIEGLPDLLRPLLGLLPASRLRADLPGGAVRVDVEILSATAFSPVGISLVGTLRLVARVDRHGSAVTVSSNAGNKHLGLADRRFEHFNPSHSRLQTNTALKFAPEIGSLVGAIWMKNWRFGGYPEPIFHSVFIQFFVAGLEAIERK